MLLPVVERLYQLLHRTLLRRLPERRAVRLGQAILRLLPLDRYGGFDLPDGRLAVDLGGVRLPNPVILSSMYHDLTILRRAMGLGFGAVTTKSITVGARPGHPEPNLVRLDTAEGPGFVNCNGFHNPGLAAFQAGLATLPRRRPLIVSVAGESADEYRRLVTELAPLADLVELNISSPNTRLVYEWSRSPGAVRALLAQVRAATTRPLSVKLSPDYPEHNREALLPALLETGVEVVNFGNTRRVEHRGLSQGAGGLSGPALFPAVLATVRELRCQVGDRVRLIATGGIDSPAKALAAIEAGADAVGLLTGFITRGPTLPRRIAEGLLAAVAARGLGSVRELRPAGPG